MVTSKEEMILNSMHMDLHGVRMMSNYKPTNFEVKMSWLISEYFQDKCEQCKAVIEQKRLQAERQMKGDVPVDNKSFLGKVFGGK